MNLIANALSMTKEQETEWYNVVSISIKQTLISLVSKLQFLKANSHSLPDKSLRYSQVEVSLPDNQHFSKLQITFFYDEGNGIRIMARPTKESMWVLFVDLKSDYIFVEKTILEKVRETLKLPSDPTIVVLYFALLW